MPSLILLLCQFSAIAYVINRFISVLLRVINFCFEIIFLILYFLTLTSFSHQRKLMVFDWSLWQLVTSSLRDSLLSILLDFNNAVVCMVSARSPIPNPFNPLSKAFGDCIKRANYNWSSCHPYVIQLYLYLSPFSFSLVFTVWSPGTASSLCLFVVFFCFFFGFFVCLFFCFSFFAFLLTVCSYV